MKTGLIGDLLRAPHARVWRGINGAIFPHKKNKFWIGGDATSRCLEELARTVHSLLVDLLVDLSRSQITRPVLKK